MTPRLRRFGSDGTAAERFADLLDGTAPVASATSPGQPGLLDLATALRRAGSQGAPAALPADVRAAMRQRLVAVATVQVTAEAAPTRRSGVSSALSWRVQKRAAALISGVAVVTSVAGVGVAAARSLPGAPFYDVKRVTESAQLWTARGDLAKGRRHLEFAQTRLAEATAMSHPSAAQLTRSLDQMDAQTRAGARELQSAYAGSHSATPLLELHAFDRRQLIGLVTLTGRVPVSVQRRERSSMVLLGTVDAAVRRDVAACTSCAATPALPGVTRRVHGHARPGGPATPAPARTPGPGVPVVPTHAATPGAPRVRPTPTHHAVVPPLPVPLPTLRHHHHVLPLPTLSPRELLPSGVLSSPGALLSTLLPSSTR